MEDGLNSLTRRRALQLGAMGAGSLALAACGASKTSSSSTGPSSTTASSSPTAPFDPTAAAGKAPDLPHRLAFPNPFNSPLFLEVERALRQGCDDRGLELLTAISNGDPQVEVQQTDGFFSRGIGGLFETPVNIPATDAQMVRALQGGMYVAGVARPNCHSQINANQTKLGNALGAAAVKWADANLGGTAKVVYFNEDDAGEALITRHHAVLAALKAGGSGIDLVSDLPTARTTAEATAAMNTVLQAHPEVNVVLGGPFAILGAYNAFQAQNREDDPKVYLGSFAGVDADYALIEKGGIYRATTGEPWAAWSYAVAQFAADWLEGKTVPRVITIGGTGAEPVLDSPRKVRDFQDAMHNPTELWKQAKLRDRYVGFFGNVSYDTRSDVWKTVVTP